jgi:hypothetical protein
MANAAIGFFKTGSPVNVTVLAPADPLTNLTLVGRVFTSGTPRGLGLVRVTLSDGVNPPRTANTSSFGYYRFDGITGGTTYTITAAKLRHTFTPKQMAIIDNLADVNFISGQ